MRIALGVEYDGSRYYGWQRQQQVDSVQQRLEQALSKVADEKVGVVCAGRTDAGVHATNQVVHFDVSKARGGGAWTLGINSNLPADIAVRWAQPVGDDFHARFSARARRYRYIIANTPLRPGILSHGVSHYHPLLDEQAMQAAAPALLGEHDFSAFRAAHCQSNSPRREVTHLTVTRRGDFIIVDIKANAFLHHMVRNIVGSLITIGRHQQPPQWLAQLLAGGDRTKAAATAKPGGLYLVNVDYPAEFQLPQPHAGPLWFAED
ncbi:MAG: tRNA pseudouridine(38-40) synthase TruA [Pseudomonadota bacterium]